MTSNLSTNELHALLHLSQIKGRSIWHQQIKAELTEPTPSKVRELLSQLLCGVRDDRREMIRLLGFDLLSVLNMKMYTDSEVNQLLGYAGQPFRALLEIKFTDQSAMWLSQGGFVQLDEIAATIWVDSDLNRFLRLANGQIFECTSRDLTSLSGLEKQNLRAYLTGIID